jgi:multimeric flavodoxin WrbA
VFIPRATERDINCFAIRRYMPPLDVLAVMGSPRKKGDSYAATRLIEEKLTSKDNIAFEYLFLRDMDLGDCIGCGRCLRKGEDECPDEGDRELIEEKMSQADGVIFVSPVYSYTVTWLMKQFLDRFAYLVHRPRFFGTPAMVFVLRGDMFKNAMKLLKRNVKSYGFYVPAQLGIPGLDTLTDTARARAEQHLEKETDVFWRAMKNPRWPAPSIYDLVSFNIWKMNASALREEFPADHAYWKKKGWLAPDARYYYPVNINPLKWLVAGIATRVARWYMRKQFRGYR